MDQLSGSRRPRRNIVPLQPLGAAASRGDGSVRQELAAGFVLRSEGRSTFGGKAENWAFPLSTPKPDDSNQHPALLEREDCTLAAWYRALYAPRTGGAYDSHHRTAGIAGRTWRRGSCVASVFSCRNKLSDCTVTPTAADGRFVAVSAPLGRTLVAWFDAARGKFHRPVALQTSQRAYLVALHQPTARRSSAMAVSSGNRFACWGVNCSAWGDARRSPPSPERRRHLVARDLSQRRHGPSRRDFGSSSTCPRVA